jgi:hypothetical protein
MCLQLLIILITVAILLYLQMPAVIWTGLLNNMVLAYQQVIPCLHLVH